MVGKKLSGEFEHALDPKGRVTLPARYRDYFRDGVVMVRFTDKEPCITVWHPLSWDDYDEKHIESLDGFENEDDAWRIREIYRNQDFVEPDAQGRILLSAQHIEDLGLSGKVKIVGNRECLEIWNPDTLEALLSEKTARRGGDSG